MRELLFFLICVPIIPLLFLFIFPVFSLSLIGIVVVLFLIKRIAYAISDNEVDRTWLIVLPFFLLAAYLMHP